MKCLWVYTSLPGKAVWIPDISFQKETLLLSHVVGSGNWNFICLISADKAILIIYHLPHCQVFKDIVTYVLTQHYWLCFSVTAWSHPCSNPQEIFAKWLPLLQEEMGRKRNKRKAFLRENRAQSWSWTEAGDRKQGVFIKCRLPHWRSCKHGALPPYAVCELLSLLINLPVTPSPRLAGDFV